MTLVFTMTVERAHAFDKLNEAFCAVDADRSGKVVAKETKRATWNAKTQTWTRTVTVKGDDPLGLIFGWQAALIKGTDLAIEVKEKGGPSIRKWLFKDQPESFLIKLRVAL